MKKFTDSKGREWHVEINVQAVRVVRDLLGINLYDAPKDGFALYTKIVGDPPLLVDVLYCLCRDQANAQGISDEEFGRGMAGDSLMHAVEAFGEELIAFFPDGQLRAVIRTTLAKAKELVAAVMKEAQTKLASLDASALATALSGTSTASPEPSASTPAG